MVKKIYITAVLLFVLTALTVNDKPDFPKSPEVDVVSDITTAQKLEWYEGTVENREYYLITNIKEYIFEEIKGNTRCEIICRLQQTRDGTFELASIESRNVDGGAPDGFRWEPVIDSEYIDDKYGYVHYLGCFIKEEDVSYMPLKKILPGIFLKNIDFTLKNYFRTETLDIRVRFNPDEIIKMAEGENI